MRLIRLIYGNDTVTDPLNVDQLLSKYKNVVLVVMIGSFWESGIAWDKILELNSFRCVRPKSRYFLSFMYT